MRGLVCRDWRPFEELELADDLPEPELKPDQVTIRVRATGMSFATNLVVQGKYQRKPPRPFTPGTEVAGEIAAIGSEVTGFAVGDRVISFVDWGGMAERVSIWAGQVYRLPDGLDYPQGIPLLSSYGTSYGALHLRARMEPGEKVLVHGAGGGVGLAAVEIAKAHGCTVIARAGTAEKRAYLTERGADHVLDSRADGFKQDVLDLTDGLGVDIVYDPIGGQVFHESLRALDRGGRVLTIGYAEGTIPEIGINLLLVKDISVMGFNWGTYWGWSPADERVRFQGVRKRVMDALSELHASGAIRPQIHATYPLAQFREAWADVRDRKALGRVCLAP
ncbi:MAG: NADPH:quinone oxidoreductase family protein [Minwuia sp.]|uniref:NADPH:quinone oxidoreductase family protein n=1 Tax=Minwuia sp. TaxID=2493630 RepID=UPI003A8B2979